MGGWVCTTPDNQRWDGTLNANTLQEGGVNLADTYVNITGDTMTGKLTMDATLGMKGADTITFSTDGSGNAINAPSSTTLAIKAGTTMQFYAGVTEQITLIDGVFKPKTDSRIDLGTTSLRYKTLFVDDITLTNTIDISSDTNLAVTAPIVLTGDTLSFDDGHLFYANVADSTKVSNTTTLSVFDIYPGSAFIPANSLAVGDIIHVHLNGVCSVKSFGACTFIFAIQDSEGSPAVWAATNARSGAAGTTDVPFAVEYTMIVRAIGASGSIQGTSTHYDINTAQGAGTVQTTTVNTTTALNLHATVKMSVADAANNATLKQYIIEIQKRNIS